MWRRPASSWARGRSSTSWAVVEPGQARRQLVGVFAPEWVRPMAEVLGRLGGERAWVVHGDGLDELTTAGPTTVAALDHGTVETFEVTAEDAGLPPARLEDLRGGEPAYNARLMRELLDGAGGPLRDVVLLNSAAALLVAGRAANLYRGRRAGRPRDRFGCGTPRARRSRRRAPTCPLAAEAAR